MKTKCTPRPSRESIEKKLKLAGDLFAMAYKVKRFQAEKKFPLFSEQEKNHYAYSLIERGCK